jgi:citrate/tricarballylate utilization protein
VRQFGQKSSGLTLSIALATGLALFQAPLQGSSYGIFLHNLLVSVIAPMFPFAALALGLGVHRLPPSLTVRPACRRFSLS